MTVDINAGQRTAIITGASRGIGAAVAIALAQRGIGCVLAVRNPDAANDTRLAIERHGGSCRVLRCDVSSRDDARNAVQKTLDVAGRLDILVNNAGQISPIGHVADTEPEQWAAAVATNLVGPYYLLQAALPALLASRGAIVNLSTGAAHTPREGWSAYCSAKAGLAMLTRCVAAEYGDRGISVYGFQPGFVDTAMQAAIRQSGMNDISRMPREKLAPPELSAGVIAWLADTRPQDINGHELSIQDASLVERARQSREQGI
ncbi:SDR family NAD(P)-dependent oxidoreductase [Candidimonas nitroreducens]|uniref:SDR family NAD(P)-dependent oxidoreductase n=1 Tax=Candidimonas nitroreducens TaxID=683354 RepID=UPI001303DE96|nr:SDR family oxidoreductase [Candidimonas nitroreducens]